MGSGGVFNWKEEHWEKLGVKKKMNVEGKVEKYKARLVEKCYSRELGINFGDIFSLLFMVISISLLYLLLLHLILR